MSCENCDCADNNDVRSLKRRLDEAEQTIKSQGQGILKVAKLVDDVSLDLKKRVIQVEEQITWHEESPHYQGEILYK
jgi:hypothetical protein